jgi:hypothetical protein
MMERQKKFRWISLTIYSLGIIIGITFIILAVWPDFEATLFDSSLSGEKPFSSLRCPIFIGNNEDGVITGSVKNPIDRAIKPHIRARISNGIATTMREIDTLQELPPFEDLPLEWKVYENDAVWGNFILFRVYQFRTYPVPSRTSACGIFLVNLPIPGIVVTILLITLSILAIIIGLWMWIKQNQPLIGRKRDITFALFAIGLLTIIGILAGLFAQLLIGTLVLIVLFLLIVVVNAYFASSA